MIPLAALAVLAILAAFGLCDLLDELAAWWRNMQAAARSRREWLDVDRRSRGPRVMR